MATRDALGELWRSEILSGAGRIDHTGAVPGTITIWGESARAILNSAGRGHPVLIAVAELGRGRVAAVAHDGLVTSSATLMTMLENWLTKGEKRQKHVITKNTKKRALIPGQLLIWKGANFTGDLSTEDAIDHITQGGSLLHAMCPWGWLQLHPGKTLQDMPLMGILNTAGLCYTESTGSIPKEGLDISSYRGSEASHTLFTLRKILTDPARYIDDEGDDDDSAAVELSSLPEDLCSAALGSELRQLSKALGCGHDESHDHSQSVISRICPTHEKPLGARKKRSVIGIVNGLARLKMASLPGVDAFLGRFDQPIDKLCEKVVIESKLKDVHPTGYYLPRGETLVVKVLGPLSNGWSVQVGAHSDNLGGVHAPLRRWPQLVVKEHVTGQLTHLHSPYGGLVYLRSPKGTSRLEVCLDNVVIAPLFDLRDPESVRSWTTRRNAPGLWADIVGENMIITLPASSVRNIVDPSGVIRCWDNVVRTHHDLRGTDPTAHRRQWVVTDEQPSAGYMHAGYPIVTHLDVSDPNNKLFLLSEDALTQTGNWGMYHELGHNMQRPSWTFSGTGEVTCNIFTLHAMQIVSGQAVWIHEWLSGQLKKVRPYVSGSSGFSQWQADPGLALFIYAQIAHHFGWEVYKTVFRLYEADQGSLNNVPDQHKIDTWFIRMSRACGYDLAPLFEFWKVPLGDEVNKEVSGLRPFLPRDEVTEIDATYADRIRARYANCCPTG